MKTPNNFTGTIIYCGGETSTNLTTDMTSTDFEFQHLEAVTIMLSFYAKLMAKNNEEVVVSDGKDTNVYV